MSNASLQGLEPWHFPEFPAPGVTMCEHYYWNRTRIRLSMRIMCSRIIVRPLTDNEKEIEKRENLCKELLRVTKDRKIEAEIIDSDTMRKWKQPAWDRERLNRQKEDDRYLSKRAAEYGMTLQEWRAREKDDVVEFQRSKKKQKWWENKTNIVQQKENNITRKHLFLRDHFVIPQIKDIRICKCPNPLSKSKKRPIRPFFNFNTGCECYGIVFPPAIKYNRVNIERLKAQTWFSHEWESRCSPFLASRLIAMYIKDYNEVANC